MSHHRHKADIVSSVNKFSQLCVYLFSEVINDSGQCFRYHLGVPAKFLNIYMRSVRHKHKCADS